ncbi:MAG: alanine dehydrogenase, partial [Gammaproteobacteria bacterium]|nr:alanine dehydrogenase [Gammaproteobacteria bacterium]
HAKPTYVVDGVIHYCVTNMPGAVAKTSTLALTNATLPYVVQLADLGWREACRTNAEIRHGANIVAGHITHSAVADAFALAHRNIADFLQ